MDVDSNRLDSTILLSESEDEDGARIGNLLWAALGPGWNYGVCVMPWRKRDHPIRVILERLDRPCLFQIEVHLVELEPWEGFRRIVHGLNLALAK